MEIITGVGTPDFHAQGAGYSATNINYILWKEKDVSDGRTNTPRSEAASYKESFPGSSNMTQSVN